MEEREPWPPPEEEPSPPPVANVRTLLVNGVRKAYITCLCGRTHSFAAVGDQMFLILAGSTPSPSSPGHHSVITNHRSSPQINLITCFCKRVFSVAASDDDFLITM